MSKLPRSVREMNLRIGTIHGFNGVKKAGEQLADWTCDAAIERYGELPEDPKVIWTNAVERWGPDLVAFRDALVRLELELLRNSGPLA